ncbi:MAG: 2TM domain-containing protein [Actinomycetota bacterium]|nr:2TM domain-containing protein [Actinomycetota bacterium]
MTDGRATRTAGDEQRLREVAVERIKRRRNLRLHALAHVVGSLFLIVVWATTEYNNAGGWPTGFRTGRMNHDWDPWIVYPLIAGTLALAVHAWSVYGRDPATEEQIGREVERLRAGSLPS